MSDAKLKEKSESFPPRHITRYCTTCYRPIKDEPFALCTHCKGFIQCLECLSCGIEKGHHLREHQFIIVESQMKPIFRQDWTIDEEMLFLDALQNCGLGNFSDMESILMFKTKEDYDAHYKSVYLGSLSSPIPEQVVEYPDSPTLMPDYPTSPEESCPSDSHELNLARKRKTAPTTPGEKASYMPKRHEFEIDYLNETEEIICQMDFNDEEDTPETFSEKMDRLVAYNNVIDERDLRTDVAIDFGMQDQEYSFPQAPTAQMNKIINMLMQLAPYFGKKSITELIDLIGKKLEKQALVETRTKWFQNGIESMDEGFLFSQLEQIANKGHLTQADIRNWKRLFDDYANSNKDDILETNLLPERELELCRYLEIPTQLYMAYKDLILREFAINGSLTREQCIQLDPSKEAVLDQIYDFLVSVGWICS